jgi:hypothetical protein
MGWAWLFWLLATYPWLLGADLATDTLASSSLVWFVSGTCLIAPSRRLRARYKQRAQTTDKDMLSPIVLR